MAEKKDSRKAGLSVEFLGLYFGLPLAFVRLGRHIPPIPILIGLALILFILLWRDRSFDRRRLYTLGPWRTELPRILGRLAVAAVGLLILTWLLSPDSLFDFPRRRPLVWLAVVILYPLFSVYPQAVIHRAWLFQRYGPLFGDSSATVLASAMAFGFMHLYFNNPVALGLTFLGGLIFARTYWRTGSLLLSAIEHALYGNLIFTIGLGRFIYHGAAG